MFVSVFVFSFFFKGGSNEPIVESDPVVRRSRIELVSRFVSCRGQNEVHLLESEADDQRMEAQA